MTYPPPTGDPVQPPENPYGPYSLPQYPADQYPADQYPADQYPADQYPADQYPMPQYPMPQYPPGTTPYGQHPPYGYSYPGGPGFAAIGTNGMAIASMVLGILWLYWIGSVLALIFGYVARSQIKQSRQEGDGMAIAGIVLGWIGVAVLAIVLVGVAVSTT